MTKDDLIAFETEIADLFNAGGIPYPVHLSDGSEDQLIRIFQDIDRDDWVFGSWRMHYECLLHGVPPADLKAAILRGGSISLCFPEYRVYSSAIVGGILPIALGAAMGIKLSRGTNRVHCFIGDMTVETGIAHECIKYSRNHHLPIRWIIARNGHSVLTPVDAVWGSKTTWGFHADVEAYDYKSKYPHAGAGKRVEF